MGPRERESLRVRRLCLPGGARARRHRSLRNVPYCHWNHQQARREQNHSRQPAASTCAAPPPAGGRVPFSENDPFVSTAAGLPWDARAQTALPKSGVSHPQGRARGARRGRLWRASRRANPKAGFQGEGEAQRVPWHAHRGLCGARHGLPQGSHPPALYAGGGTGRAAARQSRPKGVQGCPHPCVRGLVCPCADTPRALLAKPSLPPRRTSRGGHSRLAGWRSVVDPPHRVPAARPQMWSLQQHAAKMRCSLLIL